MRVFLTGGTGLIGTRIICKLMERGDEIVLLTRRYGAARQAFGPTVTLIEGDPMTAGPWMDAVQACDGVINLAGENLFNRRWRPAFKALMRDSRLRSTENVVQALARQPSTGLGKPKVLVNASAIGIYGPHGDETLTEESPPGNDYLASLCVDWEKTALTAGNYGVRVCLVRIGIVLDRQGGALAKLLLPFKLCVGGPVGNGKQWMSWIHHDDLAGLFLFGLDHTDAHGPLNGTAPNPVTNKQFSKALGRALHRPALLPTPAFMLRVVLGEVADVVAKGQRVVPQRAQSLGYQFQYSDIDAALRQIVG
jgi:uncharacterized protein (TIGR01777 family)